MQKKNCLNKNHSTPLSATVRGAGLKIKQDGKGL